MGFFRDTRTLWTRRLPLQSQNLRRLAWHQRLVKSSSKPMERWFSIVPQCSYQHSPFCSGSPVFQYQHSSFCFGFPCFLMSTFFLLFRFSIQTTRTCWTSSIPTWTSWATAKGGNGQAVVFPETYFLVAGALCLRWQTYNCRQRKTWQGTSWKSQGRSCLEFPG